MFKNDRRWIEDAKGSCEPISLITITTTTHPQPLFYNINKNPTQNFWINKVNI